MKQSTPPALQHLESKLQELDGAGLLRSRATPVGNIARTFCSNDYLGLAASEGGDTGAGASRLIVGERPEHLLLENALASWLDVPSALLFSSGYAANVGTISALVSGGDLVVSDALNHASIIDGCRLARAQVEVVPHVDLAAVERALQRPRMGRAWVVTESYFSMDADSPDLPGLRSLCDRYDAALIVDEAHALGVFGPRGRGLASAAGIEPDVRVGTLGKAFGASGAFIAGCTALSDWLWNRARSFVFSTGISPLVATAALRALRRIEGDEALRARLHENVRLLRDGLVAMGLHPLGAGPIVPLVIGDSRRALQAASELRRGGVHAQAVRPPTVPEGSARLRITTTAGHTHEDIERALVVFAGSIQWLRPSF